MRKYYKYSYQNWTQPTLTSNGIMGRSSFATSASAVYSDREPYRVFNSDTTLIWETTAANPQWLSFYSEIPLKITNFGIQNVITNDGNAGGHILKTGYIQGSNTGNDDDWINLAPFSNSDTTHGKIWYVDLSSNTEFYHYYRIYIATSNQYPIIQQLYLTGQQRTVVEGTVSDYDFYKDIDVYKLPNPIVRKYYKYVDESWVQPTLSSNGILGRGDFACSASVNYGGYYPWKVFDKAPSDGTNGWESNSTNPWFIFYNPDPLKVTQIRIQNYTHNMGYYWTKSGDIYGSNDGENWTSEPIKSFTNSNNTANEWWTIDLSSNTGYYKYYKFTNLTYSSYVLWVEMEITAVCRKSIEATASDYDYYKDVNIYEVVKKVQRNYYKYQYQTMSQPLIDKAGVIGRDEFAVWCKGTYNAGYEPYKCFDGDSSTRAYWAYTQNATDISVIWYNSDPWCLTSFTSTHISNYSWKTCKIYGSNDGVEWTFIADLSVDDTYDQFTLTFTNTNYWRYYGFGTFYNNANYRQVWEPYTITLTATEQIIVPATSSNYDFYKDENTYKALKY